MVLEVHQVAITTIHESPLGGKKKKKTGGRYLGLTDN
jgi:hypothetical protein